MKSTNNMSWLRVNSDPGARPGDELALTRVKSAQSIFTKRTDNGAFDLISGHRTMTKRTAHIHENPLNQRQGLDVSRISGWKVTICFGYSWRESHSRTKKQCIATLCGLSHPQWGHSVDSMLETTRRINYWWYWCPIITRVGSRSWKLEYWSWELWGCNLRMLVSQLNAKLSIDSGSHSFIIPLLDPKWPKPP